MALGFMLGCHIPRSFPIRMAGDGMWDIVTRLEHEIWGFVVQLTLKGGR